MLENELLLQIAKDYGTPVYVYESEKIIHQYQTLKNAFSEVDVQIKYACKALNNLNILKLLKQQGAGLDVVSIEEAELGLMAGFTAEEILFTPNCVSFDEIKKGVEMGISR
jgi:diaminopimelate decarboxylase